MLKEADGVHGLNGPATLDLGGLWRFAFTGPTAQLDDQRIRVPGIWQSQFEDLRNATGTGVYRRRVDLPPSWSTRRLHLVFDGIFHHARVRIDGREVGRHDNPWTPFEIDITDTAVRDGFDLEVEVTVPDDADYADGGFGAALHGKQDWYGIQGGIWREVRIEARDQMHLQDLAVACTADRHKRAVTVRGCLSQPARKDLQLQVMRDGAILAERRVTVAEQFGVDLPVPEAELWSPDRPALYELHVSAGDDRHVRPIGFRYFARWGGRLWLNGEPLYIFGALDQDWYPDEECRPPDTAFLRERFTRAKALGLNLLRCHVKIPDSRYFELADELGLLVWLDMPYMEHFQASARRQLRQTFESAVRQHGHHPSICIWSIANEGWGIDLDDNPDDRRWLAESFDRLKPLLPQSLLVDNSACFPRNYHIKTDIEDFHWYGGWPQHNGAFQRITAEFAGRAAWSFSPHGDGERTGDEPLICSEFGVWGLPRPDRLRDEDGREPWWFDSGHEWSDGAGCPRGLRARFRDARLGRVFGDLDRFIDQCQETQFRGLKHQIETLRAAAPISGYVITELNDTHWEANGLMDARNNVRVFGDRLAALHIPVLPVALPARTACSSGERLRVPVRLTGAAPIPARARLAWRFGATSGDVAVEPAASGGAEAVLDIEAPAVETITTLQLELSAVVDGQPIGDNTHEFCVVPPISDVPGLRPLDEGAERLLDAAGYPIGGEIAFATRLGQDVRRTLLSGGRALLIANDTDALTDPDRDLPVPDLVNFPKMVVKAREGSPWGGGWMGAFCWRRADGPWSVFANGPMLDEHWTGLLPEHVLTGFRSTAFGGLVDAGIVVGWVHKAAAISKRTALGEGWLTVSTFNFSSEQALANPLAPHVLAALARS